MSECLKSSKHWVLIIIGLMLFTLCVFIVLERRHHPVTPVTFSIKGEPVEFDRQIEARVPGNVALFRAVNTARHPALDWLTAGMTHAGDIGIILPFVALVVWIFRRTKFWALLLAILFATLLAHLIKEFYPLPRPGTLLDNVYLIRHFHWGSFPSADCATAAMLAATLCVGERFYLQCLLWGFVLLIAWERMYIGVHFPLDCLAGIVVGVLSAFLAYRLIALATRKKEAETPTVSASSVDS